jgi:hypothetical protein
LHRGHAPVSHFLFHQGIFGQKQNDCRPSPTYLSLFLRLKIKLKGRHFDTTEAMEAESQAVLNTLTEHDLQDAFKMAEVLGTVQSRGRVMVASRPKVNL